MKIIKYERIITACFISNDGDLIPDCPHCYETDYDGCKCTFDGNWKSITQGDVLPEWCPLKDSISILGKFNMYLQKSIGYWTKYYKYWLKYVGVCLLLLVPSTLLTS
jgi:hypothetical protein